MDNMDHFISVDIEAAGPIPSQYALLSIGACTLTHPQQTFYVELIPDKDLIDLRSMEVHGLDLQKLRHEGLPAVNALQQFADWLQDVVPIGQMPLMLAFNAPFDWMFIHDYFIRYLGNNPFGHTAVDIKAFYLGASGRAWQETSGAHLHQLYNQGKKLSHNALGDAIDQAVIFVEIVKELLITKDHPE
jgi:DNA polymerase III epsilon subunit-like protein